MDSTILLDSRAAAWEINSVAEAHRTQPEKLEDKFAKGQNYWSGEKWGHIKRWKAMYLKDR